MKERPLWKAAIEEAWTRRSVVWLRGVRRVGKTTLPQSLDRVRYFDCELPGVRRRVENADSFLRHNRGARVVLDEVHRLPNPSEVLKIAADHFPGTRVLATGSSTLGASARFRDTLAGRKADVFLPPLVVRDLASFGRPDLEHRMLRGGLPPFFLAPTLPERDFQEWTDAYWAKDIMELFRLEKRPAFQRTCHRRAGCTGGTGARLFPRRGDDHCSRHCGTQCHNSTPAFVLGDPDKLEVVADLDASKGDTEIREMYEGMPVTIIVDAKPDTQSTGTIRQLPSPYGTGESDEGSIHVVLDQAPSANTYQAGDKVTALVQLASKENVLWLPQDAIRKAGGRTFVIINSDSGPKRVGVEIGCDRGTTRPADPVRPGYVR